jgi:arylformamidase
MAIHDISLSINNQMVVWPGDPSVEITTVHHLDRGDNATVSGLRMGAHTGTHVDAPAHFIKAGVGVDALDLETLVGPCLVVAVQGRAITSGVLEAAGIPEGTRRVLFATGNGDLWRSGASAFSETFVAVTLDGARWLVDHGVRLVGVDYLSVAPWGQSGPVHRCLLGAGVVVVEGLNLSAILPGPYHLVCLPLKIAGADGAPARAILIDG